MKALLRAPLPKYVEIARKLEASVGSVSQDNQYLSIMADRFPMCSMVGHYGSDGRHLVAEAWE